MSGFKMDLLRFWLTCWIVMALSLRSCSCCGCQFPSENRDINGILVCADNFRSFLLEMCRIVSLPDVFKEVKGLNVAIRTSENMAALLDDVIRKMERLLNEKEAAVEALKNSAEKAMKNYGPYQDFIDFKDVQYVNSKEVVVKKDMDKMDNESIYEIQGAINFLPTEPTWNFKPEGSKPMLNINISTIHVPTNIYDKSMRILNGIKWTTNLTAQFIANNDKDNSLRWQYFCSADGIFRIYPGMQWPREADKVDTFDCRIRRWYIQAASYPKNILILLDSSGSMKGLRYAIARSTVNKILETLSDEDYFNVIQFSDEPRYVDECFNDTLMAASVDNIKRMQGKIAELEAKKYSDFEKALTKAFQLFRKEQMEFREHNLCNKAIMIITDGAPENFDSVFDEYNWPEKSIRVFTFLIGKEVPDNRQTRWMACVNKGKFTQIATRADVQENVQKYIKVLSRPLALQKARHKVWSPVYLDYVTEQADMRVPSGRPSDLHMDYESDSVYEGLGLVMSMSMPVFDARKEVGVTEEAPEMNLLGVVGTDLRINDLMKFIPTFKLGVNGYAFAITNHGYVLFHPDYRPFYSEKLGMSTQHLKVRPKYNSVDLTQVELTTNSDAGSNKENPLRRYLFMSKSGGDNVSVLAYTEGVKRARERQNHYQFKEVADTFKLVFVVPNGYGSRYITVDPNTILSIQELNQLGKNTSTNIDLSSWIYCWDDKTNTWTQMDIITVSEYLKQDITDGKCDRDHMYRLLKDWELSLKYGKAWEEKVKRLARSETESKYVDGIGKIWIGTASGLTRSLEIGDSERDWRPINIQTIKSPYYKRAVDGWEDGYRYIFAGPVVATQKEFNFNTSFVTMSTAVILGSTNSTPVPAAVVAFNMRYSAFYDKFIQHTINCSETSCSCNDTEHFYCYLIDNNGYILATNSPGRNGTGLLLGQYNGRLMRALLDDAVFKQLNIRDYQSICETPFAGEQGSASSFIMNPLKLIARFIFWMVTKLFLFVSEWNMVSLFRENAVCGYEGETSCGSYIPEEIVRYLCGFVINPTTGQKVLVAYASSTHSCVQNFTRFVLNLNVLKARRKRYHLTDCATVCSSKNKISYDAHWLNDTNLVFVVVDATCICNDSENTETNGSGASVSSHDDGFTFSLKAKEVFYDDNTQCQNLRNFSDELKHVDITRFPHTFCLDSSNETATPCGQSPALINSHVTSNIPVLLTALLTLVICTYH